MKQIIFTVFSLLITMAGFAQEDSTDKSKRELRRERIDELAKLEEEGVITHSKHFAAGAKLASDGYGGFLELGRAQGINSGMLYQFEIMERKHTKEEKQSVDFFGIPLIYGKVNYFYTAKLGAQKWINLGNKGNKNGVSVTANFGGGLTLGLLRPYELRVGSTKEYVSYASDSTEFLRAIKQGDITEGPGFSNGWSDLKIVPGLYAKPALRFDYGQYNEVVSAIEIGISAEFYSKKIHQMIGQKENRFFFSPYVTLIGGKRK